MKLSISAILAIIILVLVIYVIRSQKVKGKAEQKLQWMRNRREVENQAETL